MLSEQAIRIISSFFVGVYIARHLGPASFGVLSYLLALSTFLVAISRLGMDAVLVRDLVLHPGDSSRFMGTAFWLMFIAGIFSYFALVMFYWITESNQDIRWLVVVIGASGLFIPFLAIDYYFQSRVEAAYGAFCKSSALIVMSAVKIWMVHSDASLIWFVAAYLFDNIILAIFLVLAAHAKKMNSFFTRFDFEIAKSMLRSAAPMVITAISMVVLMRIDQVMINAMLGAHAVGIYAAALKIYEAWATLPYMLTISLLPAIARLKKDGEVQYHLALRNLFSLVIWLSLAAFIFIYFFGEQIILLSFGEAYRESASLTSLLMFTGVFAAMGSVSARYFNIERMELKIATRAVLAALVNIAMNYFLIPILGVRGAVYSTLFCAAFSFYILDWFDPSLKKLLKIKHSSLLPLDLFGKNHA